VFMYKYAKHISWPTRPTEDFLVGSRTPLEGA